MIKKVDMRERIGQAAAAAPNLAQRLVHATSMANAHPALPVSAAQPPAHHESPISEIPQAIAPGTSTGSRDLEPHGEQNTRVHRHVIVPLDQIDPNPFNARKIYRSQRVNELSASIGANGQDTPGTATIRNGRYVLAAGHYRLRALKLLNAKTMELTIRENLSDRDLYAISFRENNEREGQSTLDNAMCWKELLHAGVYSSETEIADVTGLSLSNVNKTMAALRLSPAMLELVGEDPTAFKLSVLYELVLLEAVAGTDRTIEVARQVLEGSYGRDQVQEIRASLASPAKRKSKEFARHYKLGSGGANVGSLKEWDSGKVAFEINLPDPAARSALIEELKARFPAPAPGAGSASKD